MILYDLHVHTTNSDGRDLPREVFRRAQARKLQGLVITDHSGVTYSDELVQEAQLFKVTLLFPGVEISTKFEGSKFHVLVYGQGIDDPDFQAFAFRPTLVKNLIYQRIVEELVHEGYSLPPIEDILNGSTGDGTYLHPGKWMLSKTLISSYLTRRTNMSSEAVKTLLLSKYERLKERVPDRYVDTVETIRRIREVNALPVLAHPWWECTSGLNSPDRVNEQIQTFKQAGLLGIEVTSRHYTEEQNRQHLQVARDLDLLAFAGSDYHGDGKSELGQYGFSHDQLADMIRFAQRHGCRL